ncbi:MAG: hypothetical protein ACE5FT_05520 [Candidatus Nanoarchaeia archaeon]
MVKLPWDINKIGLKVTKHFSRDYMRKWDWDFHDLREAIRDAYKVDKVGKNKYELYVQKSGYKKIITVHYDEELICISGSEGGGRK